MTGYLTAVSVTTSTMYQTPWTSMEFTICQPQCRRPRAGNSRNICSRKQVSESYFGFYAGAKKARGSSESGAKQQYMSVLDVDVDRWVPEISPTNWIQIICPGRNFIHPWANKTYKLPINKNIASYLKLKQISLLLSMERYEVFMDEVKPQDLSLTFLREFMSLPKSYFNAGAPIKYHKLNKLCLIDINFNLHLSFSLLCDVGPLPVKWV